MKTTVSNVRLMDCMAGMAEYPDKYFDLAIVDPPYGIVSQQKRGIGSRIYVSGKMNDWNGNKPDAAYFKELFRVSRFQIVWGANNFVLPESEYFIVWDKQQAVPNFASAEYAWTNVRMPAKVFQYSTHQMVATRKKESGKIHPTQKPIDLYEWLLKNYAKPGDKILDTHLGSGSSRIAAYKLGFDFYGFEIDPDYFRDADKRFRDSIAMPLFDSVPNVAEQAKLF